MEIGINKNPKIFSQLQKTDLERTKRELDFEMEDEIDQLEIFDLIRNIPDPEHPRTLEELGVVNLEDVLVDEKNKSMIVYFTPTVPTCSSASLIGLCIKIKLIRNVSKKYFIDVFVKSGTHNMEKSINKQLNDKERVAAANENTQIFNSLNQSIDQSDQKVDLKYLNIF